MSDENKEKILPDSVNPTDEEVKAESAEIDKQDTIPETQDNTDDWQWDAAVPETASDEIVFDEIKHDVEEHLEASDENDEKDVDDDDDDSEDGKCIVCGNNRGNSGSDLYCEECCKKFMKTNLGIGYIILAFVMVFVAAIGYFVCVATCEVSNKLVVAEQYINEKKYDMATEECSSVTDTVSTLNSGVNAVFTGINANFASKDWFNEGTRNTRIVLDSYVDVLTASSDDLQTFEQAVENAYTEDELKMAKNAKIKNCYDVCKKMEDYSNTFIETLSGYINGDGTDENYKIPYEKAIAYLDSLETSDDVERSVVEYYKALTGYYAGKGADEILGYYGKAYNYAGDYSYMFLQSYMGLSFELKDYNKLAEIAEIAYNRNLNDTSAYYYMVKSLIMNEKYNDAIKVCDTMKENNPDGLDYYYMKSEVLRRQGKFEDAVNLCKDGIKAGSSSEIYRQQAIAYMLMDKKDSAVEAIKSAYDLEVSAASASASSGISLECVNTTALICCICGDTEKYDEIAALMKEQGAEFEDNVKKCIKGDILFEDIFMNGTGDV